MAVVMGIEVVSDDDVSMFGNAESFQPDEPHHPFKTLHAKPEIDLDIDISSQICEHSETESLLPEKSSVRKMDRIKRYLSYIVHTVELPCKVIVIGDSGVGKTSYVQQYVTHVFHARRTWTAGGEYADISIISMSFALLSEGACFQMI